MPGPQDSPVHRRPGRKLHEAGSQREDATPTPEPDEKVPHRKARLGPGAEGVTNAGGIFKSAAVAILRQEKRLMTTGDITRLALERNLINCQGKTPEATMASALYTDVRKKGNASVFIRPVEGLFGLRDWEAEGFKPEGWPEGVPFTNSPICRKAGHSNHNRARQGPGRASKARASTAWREASADTESELGSDISGTPVSCTRKRHSDDSHGTSSNGALGMLGDVCMTDYIHDDEPARKRRPGQLQVPEPSGRIIQPKSPLEDGLAALHEIATSPNPFGFLLSTGNKTKPQIILPAEDHEGAAEALPDGPPSSCQPARFVAYTQATPSGKQLVYMSGDQPPELPISCMSPFPGYSKAAGQIWNQGASSPSPECLVDSLATPAAMYAMGLPDQQDATLPAARSAMHSMDGSGQGMPVLPSPRQQQQQQQPQQHSRPPRPGAGQLPRRMQPSPRSSGYKSSTMVPVQQAPQVPMFHPPPHAHNPLQLAFIVPHHLHPAFASALLPPGHLAAHPFAHPAAGYRPGAVAIQVQAMHRSMPVPGEHHHHRAALLAHDPHAMLGALHARAEVFESTHGRHHPEVFKQWMLVSQAYQSMGEPKLAEQCIQRAKSCWDVCLRRGQQQACEGEFQYLFNRLKSLSTGGPGLKFENC